MWISYLPQVRHMHVGEFAFAHETIKLIWKEVDSMTNSTRFELILVNCLFLFKRGHYAVICSRFPLLSLIRFKDFTVKEKSELESRCEGATFELAVSLEHTHTRTHTRSHTHTHNTHVCVVVYCWGFFRRSSGSHQHVTYRNILLTSTHSQKAVLPLQSSYSAGFYLQLWAAANTPAFTVL